MGRSETNSCKSLGNGLRIDPLDPANSLRGLDSKGRNTANAVAIMCGNRLDIGRNSGARRGIKPGNRQHHGWTHSHAATKPKVKIEEPEIEQPDRCRVASRQRRTCIPRNCHPERSLSLTK